MRDGIAAAERRYLLLDDRVIESVDGAQLTLGAVSKHPANPLFAEDKPWEQRFDNLYANVIYDPVEGLYKCWYSPFIIDNSSLGMAVAERQHQYVAPREREMGICYATSEDGITWTKPEMGLVAFDGSTANNILWRGAGTRGRVWHGPHGTGIFRDEQDPDPARRYKALLKSEMLSVAFSADGIHWGDAIACPEANSAGDTHNNAFWAPTLGKYVGITRQWAKPSGRQVARTESSDFLNWTRTVNVLQGETPNLQTYAMPVFFHSGMYFGLLAIHDQSTDRVWTELTCSPDTTTWQRVHPGTPFIGNDGTEGDYDWGCVYAAACPILGENEIRFYYGGSDGLHTGWRNGFFCLATLRPDGFAGYRAEAPATVTTRPMSGGSRLRMSADVDPGGSLDVSVLNDAGEVIVRSEPVAGLVTDVEVCWPADMKDLPAQSRLRFALSGATVYSFTLD